MYTLLKTKKANTKAQTINTNRNIMKSSQNMLYLQNLFIFVAIHESNKRYDKIFLRHRQH